MTSIEANGQTILGPMPGHFISASPSCTSEILDVELDLPPEFTAFNQANRVLMIAAAREAGRKVIRLHTFFAN